MEKPDTIVLRLCSTCTADGHQGDTDRLEAAIAKAELPVAVQLVPQACMNGCSSPVTMALQGQGMATCFFAGVDPAADCDDIVGTLRAYIASPAGWIEDARPCGRLRHCLVGRVPAL